MYASNVLSPAISALQMAALVRQIPTFQATNTIRYLEVAGISHDQLITHLYQNEGCQINPYHLEG